MSCSKKTNAMQMPDKVYCEDVGKFHYRAHNAPFAETTEYLLSTPERRQQAAEIERLQNDCLKMSANAEIERLDKEAAKAQLAEAVELLEDADDCCKCDDEDVYNVNPCWYCRKEDFIVSHKGGK